uniref:Uncharacterized protein n=1 Tax=Anguilla anguilla TaxID=7936 RepID=A0A0E9RCY5_ANGAN
MPQLYILSMVAMSTNKMCYFTPFNHDLQQN